jgi:hypothetical protein
MVALSTGDVNSSLLQPIAAEFDYPPFFTTKKRACPITFEHCLIDIKFV